MGQAASMCRFRGCRYKKNKSNKSNSPPASGLHLRSIEEPSVVQPTQNNRMLAEQGGTGFGSEASLLGSRTGVPLQMQNNTHHPAIQTQKGYDAEYARMESWMDENQEFVQDYFLRKATRQVVDAWLVSHATLAGNDVTSGSPTHTTNGQNCSSRGGSGATTPVRKISAHEFERGGLLKPIVNTIDGTPTFLSVGTQNDCSANNNTSSTNGSVSGIQSVSGIAGSHHYQYHHNHHSHHNHHYNHQTGSGNLHNHNYYRPQRLSRNELKQLDEKELIFELVKDICNELEVRTLCHKILQNVSILLNADRGSLFLVQGRCNGSDGIKKCLVSKLFDVCPRSTVEEMQQQEEVRVAWGSGIAGHVAESGEPVNIPDAYQDERFNCEIDTLTGYRTKTLLCMPIKDSSGDVIGVAQVINKLSGEHFSEADEKVFASYLQFCGIGLRNAQLYEKSQLEIKRNQVLLDLARMIFEEQSTIEHMVFRILTHMQSLIQCQRVQILLVHEASKGSFSRVFDFEANDLSEEDSISRTSPYESRFPINIGITGYVATTGETVNIPNAYEDDRFDASVDDGLTFKHKSILCMAIKNSLGQIIGVIQLVNKFDDLNFTKNDENFVEAFAIFCGMGIHNTHMYEKAIVAMAKQSVTLEVLSYHASATIDEAHRLRRLRVPSAAHFRLHDFKFDDIHFEDDDTLKACLRMFLDLDFVERFHIDYEVLCRWLLSVKKNYRNVTYHNWRHAFNVAQMMFAILTTTQWWKIFGEIECLALIIGCLCHDLDHRGTNNSFQIKASSPLAQLYSTSTMEHHHFDQCLMILNSPGNQILANLSSDDYCRVIRVLEDAILSTDLAVYFRKREPFLQSVQKKPMAYWLDEEPRALLRAMSMTVCDLSAITKPWEIEKRVADLVSSEFFEQGDMEKEELNITPIDIMNREKEDELPKLQVNFIESICMPIYDAFAKLSDKLEPLVEGVRDNREHWIELAERSVQSPVQSNDPVESNDALNANNNNHNLHEKCKNSNDDTKTIEKVKVEEKDEIVNDSDIEVQNSNGDCLSSASSCLSTPPPTGEEDNSPLLPSKAILAAEAKLIDANLKSLSEKSFVMRKSNCKTYEYEHCNNIRKASSLKGANELHGVSDVDNSEKQHQLHNDGSSCEYSKSTPSCIGCSSSYSHETHQQQSEEKHVEEKLQHQHHQNYHHHNQEHHEQNQHYKNHGHQHHSRHQQNHHHHHHHHHLPNRRSSGSSNVGVASLNATATDSDKIPKIVGKLGNVDSTEFFASATACTDSVHPHAIMTNGLNGHLNFLGGNLMARRHSETNGQIRTIPTTISAPLPTLTVSQTAMYDK